jgi:Domain of unknown function (DUF3943)
MCRAMLSAVVAVACAGANFAAAQGQAPSRSPSLLRAAGAVVVLNGLTWSYDRYVEHWDWARVGPSAWWRNLETGFRWDDDALTDNQLAHPLHGSLYFNSARGAGYSFWGSVPFVALGSLSWEFLAENVPPSPNDVVNTTFGGTALGEAMSRLATLTRPRNRVRAPVTPGFAFGTGCELPTSTRAATSYPFLALRVRYGSMYAAEPIHPFDAFDLGVELTRGPTWHLRRLSVSGLLVRSAVHRTTHGSVAFGVMQHYEFLAEPMILSGPSVAGAFLYRRALGTRTELSGDVQVEAIVLAEVQSEEGGVRRRDYDYAPGLGMRFGAAFRRAGRDVVALQTRAVWLRSVYGADASHLAVIARVSGTVPVTSGFSVGCEAGLTWRRSAYPAIVVRREVPEVRAYVAWPGW